jgi:uncharacterized membrane protein (DUF4010 family)
MKPEELSYIRNLWKNCRNLIMLNIVMSFVGFLGYIAKRVIFQLIVILLGQDRHFF